MVVTLPRVYAIRISDGGINNSICGLVCCQYRQTIKDSSSLRMLQRWRIGYRPRLSLEQGQFPPRRKRRKSFPKESGLCGDKMKKAEFEILSGITPFMLGKKVSARLQAGWELHGNTWSTGNSIHIEFHQAVMKTRKTISREITKWD